MNTQAQTYPAEAEQPNTKNQLMLMGAALLSILLATAVMTENANSAVTFENWTSHGTLHIAEI